MCEPTNLEVIKTWPRQRKRAESGCRMLTVSVIKKHDRFIILNINYICLENTSWIFVVVENGVHTTPAPSWGSDGLEKVASTIRNRLDCWLSGHYEAWLQRVYICGQITGNVGEKHVYIWWIPICGAYFIFWSSMFYRPMVLLCAKVIGGGACDGVVSAYDAICMRVFYCSFFAFVLQSVCPSTVPLSRRWFTV